MELAGSYIKTGVRPAISRSSAALHFTGAYFKSFDDLFDLLEIEHVDDCLFSDLTLGAWRGHWVAGELCSQLGIDSGPPVQPVIGQADDSRSFDYADTVSIIIDNESKGDVNRMRAFEVAGDILAAARQQNKNPIIIFLPTADQELEHEDQYLIEFLNRGVITETLVLVTCGEHTALPSHWQMSWLNEPGMQPIRKSEELTAAVPGIVSVSMGKPRTEDIRQFRILKNGSVLVAPDARNRHLRDLPPEAPAWLLAYQMILGNAGGKDFRFLQAQAGERFSEGGYNIALRLLDGAKKYTDSPEELAGISAQQQNIRIALMRFQEASVQPLPEADIPEAFRASLLQSKAWGLVMMNSPHEAETYFAQARDLLSGYQDSRLFLYLLNISALNKLRLNQHAAALAFEKTIEDQLSKQRYTDWHIAYVNNINQARLYKKTNELALSEAYYHRAFAITYNLRNESDLFYTNFCLAQLHAKKGEDAAALICYFRAALHWLANPLPEAMAPRVISAVMGGPVPNQHAMVDGICGKLSQLIKIAAKSASLSDYFQEAFQATEQGCGVHFARPDADSDLIPVFACGASGWGLLVCDQPVVSKYMSEAYQHLEQLIFDMIRKMLPAVVFPSNPTILVDACFGTDMPAQPTELIGVMVRHGVSQIYWGTNERFFTRDELVRIEQKMIIQLSPAISYIRKSPEGWHIHFRRYRSPQLCTAMQIAILELTDGQRTMEDIALSLGSRADVISEEIRFLEHDGIIQLVHG
jgi:hypothetical protein